MLKNSNFLNKVFNKIKIKYNGNEIIKVIIKEKREIYFQLYASKIYCNYKTIFKNVMKENKVNDFIL